MKKTKRKAFNFLRSYFDVLNELKDDADKLSFLMSIINKQFLNEDPKELGFIPKLCYESQRHSIESSVKGWIRVAKTDLTGVCMTDPPTNPPALPLTKPKEEEGEVKEEEEVEEEEQEEETIKPMYSTEVHDCFDKCVLCFDIHLQPKTESSKNNWLDTIDKLNRIDNIDFNTIIEITRKTRLDDFWAKNFLSLTKLRKTNPDGVKYIVVFNEKIKGNGKRKNGAFDLKTKGAELEQALRRHFDNKS